MLHNRYKLNKQAWLADTHDQINTLESECIRITHAFYCETLAAFIAEGVGERYRSRHDGATPRRVVQVRLNWTKLKVYNTGCIFFFFFFRGLFNRLPK